MTKFVMVRAVDDKRYIDVTPWFPHEMSPHREGAYQCKFADNWKHVMLNYKNGNWYFPENKAPIMSSFFDSFKWRGVMLHDLK